MFKKYIHTVDLSKSLKKKIDIFNSDKSLKYCSVECEVCKSIDFTILFNNDRHGINQRTVVCKKCGFLYSNPRMDEKFSKIFYNSDLYRVLYTYNQNVENKNDLYTLALKELKMHRPQKISKANFKKYYKNLYLDFICNEINDFETVLDVGCGKGTKLVDFESINKKAYGIEPSQEFNKAHLDFGLKSKIGFIDDIQDDTYDLIILSHVFEHLTDLRLIMKKIAKITNKYLFIEVPGHFRKMQSIQNAHNYYFSINTLNFFVLNSGFKLIKIDYAKDNEFILALYEKTSSLNYYEYDFKKEIGSVKKIYNNYKIKFLLIMLLNFLGIKRLVLKIYNKIRK